MAKPIIVSGIQPTGNLHIGNYLGAVKNWVELQNSGNYDLYIFIADLHALTGNQTADDRRKQIHVLAAELLAAGIDPKKTTFFLQSDVVGHTELGWIFNTITPVTELYRMTQFKDKMKTTRQIQNETEYKEPLTEVEKNSLKFLAEDESDATKILFRRANAGLLTYPTLMAADILLYKAGFVPVGMDQTQHLELTNDIGRWFNNRYGVCFGEVKPLLTNLPKVMSLLEPTKKMSKSLGGNHVLELADESPVITDKLKRAVTATEGGADAPGVQNLLQLLKEFGDAKAYNEFAAAEKNKSIRYGDLKQALADAMNNYFANFRSERTKLIGNGKKLEKVLADGAKKAEKVADQTMVEVKKLVGQR